MSSFKRKMQRQIQKNNGTLLHKKVVARKMGCKSVEEYNRRMARREKNLKEMEDNKDGKQIASSESAYETYSVDTIKSYGRDLSAGAFWIIGKK